MRLSPEFVAELQHASPTHRKQAVERLGVLTLPAAIVTLSRLQESEPNPDVRQALREALIALEELPVAQHVEALLPALAPHVSEQERTLALEWLVRFYKRTSPEDQQRIQAAVAVLAVPLAEPWRGRYRLTLERLGPQKIALPSAPDALVKLLTDGDEATRSAALIEIISLGEGALPALEKGLTHTPMIRLRSIEALGNLRHPKAVPILVEARRTHPELVYEIDTALLQLVKVLTDVPDANLFGLYSRLIRDFVYEVPILATMALQAVVVLARHKPERLHRTVLSLIKPKPLFGLLGASSTLLLLAQELDTLTQAYKDLPIPTTPNDDARDLPRPSKPE